VKAKRDGYEIIIADQQKALEMVGKIMGAFTDNVRVEGTVKSLIAVADLAKMDPQEASRKYQEFIRGKLAANRADPRNSGERTGYGPGFVDDED
jgi:collagenase-like PrtC family protease